MDGENVKEKENRITAATEVSVSELAAVLDRTASWVYRMTMDGVFQKTGRGRFLLADSIRRYIDYMKQKLASGSEGDLEKTKQTAEAELKSAKARIASMEADELSGKMHRSEDVAAMTADLLFAVRGALTALPGRLAMDVAQMGTAAEAAEAIRREVNKTLREIAQYKYDPLKYEERVRERMDWESVMEEDDDDG